MTIESSASVDVSEPRTDAALTAKIDELQDRLERGNVREARALVADMQRCWPDTERVRHLALVLAPPVVTPAPGRGRSFAAARAWLRAHAREYPGCWIAVKGDNLLAADRELKVVDQILKQDPAPEEALLHFQPAPQRIIRLDSRPER